MTKKRVNQAWQAYEEMPDSERKEIAMKLKCYQWFLRNGKCHAIRNPYERY